MDRIKAIRGFSLVELICVIAIVATLMSLLFPVFTASKRKAHEASTISNMRQLVMATLLYEQDNGDFPVGFYPDKLFETGYIKESTLLSSQADPFSGIVSQQALCSSRTTKVDVSYHWPFEPFGRIWNELKRVDDNPGIFATMIFSERTRHFTTRKDQVCSRITFMYDKRFSGQDKTALSNFIHFLLSLRAIEQVLPKPFGSLSYSPISQRFMTLLSLRVYEVC